MPLTVQQVANQFTKRLNDDKDVVVAVTGAEGDGKSTLAMQLGMASDPAFHLERNVLYSPNYEEMKNKIVGLPKYSTVVADEAIKSLYKLRWQEKLQKYINTLYAICRQENKLSLLCMPRFIDFNEYFRQHRIKFWIHVIDPISKSKDIGHAVIFGKSWNPFTQDAWNFKDMQKSIDDYSRQKRLKEVEFSLSHKSYVLAKSRNYIGTMEFGKMQDDMFSQYTELKKKFAYDDLDTTKTPSMLSRMEERYRQKVVILINELITREVPIKDISDKLGMTAARVYQLSRALNVSDNDTQNKSL